MAFLRDSYLPVVNRVIDITAGDPIIPFRCRIQVIYWAPGGNYHQCRRPNREGYDGLCRQHWLMIMVPRRDVR